MILESQMVLLEKKARCSFMERKNEISS